jgi:8-oxo-dGTP diphosphatase
MFYQTLKRIVGIFFNMLNLLLHGNLPPLGSVCVIVVQDGRYLVVERLDGSMVFPGGFMRWNEVSEQTAQREGREETGLDLHIGDLIGCYTTPSTSFSTMSAITIIHRAEVIGGELRGSIEGQPRWVEKAALHSLLPKHYQPIFSVYLQQDDQRKTAGVR